MNAQSQAAQATTPAISPDWLNEQTQRAVHFTSQALQSLGLPADEARQAAQGGGVMLNGMVCSVGLMPLPGSTPGAPAPLMVTLNTGRTLGELSLEDGTAMLSLAPMLSLFHAAVGCDAAGRLCLFRQVPAQEVSADGLADAVRHAWHLAQLVWGDLPAAQGAV